MAWVYMLSCADGTLYIGAAEDLERRITAHNQGKAARYTRGRRPVRLVWSRECADFAQACREEYQLKKLPRNKRMELAQSETGAISHSESCPPPSQAVH